MALEEQNTITEEWHGMAAITKSTMTDKLKLFDFAFGVHFNHRINFQCIALKEYALGLSAESRKLNC